MTDSISKGFSPQREHVTSIFGDKAKRYVLLLERGYTPRFIEKIIEGRLVIEIVMVDDSSF